jgi:hypothetical protein
MGAKHVDRRSMQQEERRRWARLACSRFVCSCALKLVSPADPAVPEKKLGAVLLNICASGVCFESNFKPPNNARLHFEIRPIEGPDVVAKIRVLHARPSGANGLYIIGSEFDELSELDRQNLLTVLHTIGRMEEDLANE